jgi:hypothetical protein
MRLLYHHIRLCFGAAAAAAGTRNLRPASMAAVDYSDLFGSDELSDLTIVLKEDAAETAPGRVHEWRSKGSSSRNASST